MGGQICGTTKYLKNTQKIVKMPKYAKLLIPPLINTKMSLTIGILIGCEKGTQLLAPDAPLLTCPSKISKAQKYAAGRHAAFKMGN
jgi:hypothetical protein